MDMVLTKDADKMICKIYKSYLEKIRDGMQKRFAKDFMRFEKWSKELFPKDNPNDVHETAKEVCRAFDMKIYTNGGFILNDQTIYYMENRFKDGLKGVVDFLLNFV